AHVTTTTRRFGQNNLCLDRTTPWEKVSLFTWMPGIKSCRIKAPRDIALGKTSWISFVWLGTLKISSKPCL
ncbi:hypothetical protein, partial [Staphylococcus haemolyticus]|uniref:hypothetical protein n=1 Tax=Staphylococcus haemolyticus TaxID=1283 RepID=UPI001C5F7255